QAGAGEGAAAVPLSGAEGEEPERDVVPRRGVVEEIADVALAPAGVAVEIAERRMRNERRQRFEPISSKSVSASRRSPRAYASSIRLAYAPAGRANARALPPFAPFTFSPP